MRDSLNLLSATSQLAALLAQRSGEGFSKDPADYQLPWVRFSGPEYNDADPKYRPDLDPLGFLIGKEIVGPEGVTAIVLGCVSGCQERDRVVVEGEKTTRLHAFWKAQPEITVVRGKGGGLKTDRGGWITGKHDEVFLLIDGAPYVITLYDAHHIVTDLNRRAQSLGVNAMYEINWHLTKATVADGQYTRSEPRFEPLAIAGEPGGPTEAEIARARKLSALVAQLSYANPPETDPQDPGATPDDSDIPF